MQRCVKIATKSVHYFRRFNLRTNEHLHFYIYCTHEAERTPFQTHYFSEIVCLERGPLSLVSTIEELLETKNSGSGLESRDYGRSNPLRWLRNIPLSAKAGNNLSDRRR
jgi:hypothetical protein